MTLQYAVRPPQNKEEVDALLENHRPIFDVPAERIQAYGDLVGQENFRIILADGKLVGGLAIVHMGQFFGGNSVPTWGIAAVGVAPSVRGKGAATELMQAVMREAYEKGCPLSTLYPATQPLYRYAGYEVAGCLYDITLPLDVINMRDRSLNVRPIEEGDIEAIKHVYTQSVRHGNGPLDRGDYLWKRVFKPREGEADGFLVERDGEVEGYIYYIRRQGGKIFYSLRASDLAAITPEAGRRLLSFLADHRSLADQISLYHPSTGPIWNLLPEQSCQVRLDTQWMLRVTHVIKALEMRGYAAGMTGELHLEIHGDFIEENNGRFVLQVADRRGKVTPGGEGRLKVHIRGLAALYSGHRTARQLMIADLLEGEPADLDIAEGIFAGPSPWMCDQF